MSGRLLDSVLFPSRLYTDKCDLTFTTLYIFPHPRKVGVHREKMKVASFRSETMKNASYSRVSLQSDAETWQNTIIEWRLIKSRSALAATTSGIFFIEESRDTFIHDRRQRE